MKKTTMILSLAVALYTIEVKADEGMWLPFNLKENIIKKMHERGLQITDQDIYSTTAHDLSEAVVGLGQEGRPFRHFCTGGLISKQGLFITNHHCGYGHLQKHSTLQNDYLTDGFWAYSFEEELTNPGLTVSILRKMEDVTKQVLEGVDNNMSNNEQDSIIKRNIKSIEEQAVIGTHYQAKVNPFYNNNEYYLSVYEIFKDIRLVGAPPSSIGKFGGDTDNWVWPRHTGDFLLFRIYAGPDNKPAPYSPENQPYIPDKYFEINGNGVNDNDFTFVMGYPGTTKQYLHSSAIAQIKNIENPIKIELRNMRIETMKHFMDKDREVRIKYSNKVAGIANGWKKWIGEIQGLERFNVIEQKKEIEKKFEIFASQRNEYKNINSRFEAIYQEMSKILPMKIYYIEGAYQIELIQLALQLRSLIDDNQDNINKTKLISTIRNFHKDYHQPIDKELFKQLLIGFNTNVPAEYQPDNLKELKAKFKNDYEKMATWFFAKTIYSDSSKLINYVKNYSAQKRKTILNDPVYKLYSSIQHTYKSLIEPQIEQLEKELPTLSKQYIKGLREMQTNKIFYPDANSTFRIAFGQVKGYNPHDAIEYKHHTTIKGIMEKVNPDIYDYAIPNKLIELYKNNDFGNYANQNNQLPVCFAATNHTTGGNSGSPILDTNGRIVGINFDRAWEGVMSDLYYNPEICRNIGLDIRFALFIIDKYAQADNLIKEMEIYR